MEDEIRLRDPCPIVAVTFSLHQPTLTLLSITDAHAEQEGNRLLRYWSQALATKEELDVRVESIFANGYHIQTLHHLRSFDCDGTIRSHILDYLAKRPRLALEWQGRVWTPAQLASDLQGWPPQQEAARCLASWATNRQTFATLPKPFGSGSAEYAAVLLRLLLLDYPAREATTLALLEMNLWTDQEPQWWHGVTMAHKQATRLLFHFEDSNLGECT